MSECSLSGRGQGHVSNFYIVGLENFAIASRWYTGDIYNSTVVGLFMTRIRQWKRLTRVTVECVHMFTTHRPTLTLQFHNFDLFRTCRTALLRGNWQDFNWHDASRGPSAASELLVYSTFRLCVFGTPVSPAKTDEPMETPSRRQTCVGPRIYTVVKKPDLYEIVK